MNRVTAACCVPGWTTAWITYVAVVRTTASPVNAGRKRNATATGIRKNASRACEYAPPDRTASTPIATMSIAVATIANRSPTLRRWTYASTPALQAAKSASMTRNQARSSFGAMLSPTAISATARWASAVASPDQAGKVGRSTRLLDQAPPHRARDGRGAIRDAELLVEMLHVGLHRRQAEVELLRDLGQALARRDHVQDLLLARGERRRIRLLAKSDLRDEAGGDIRRHDVLAPGAREHGVGDLLAACLFRDEAGGSDLERPVDDAAVRERRDDQDAGRKLLADDHVGHRDAVELRQLVVQQRNVGLVLLDLGERGASVLGFRHDLDVAARKERPHHSFAVEGVVVGDDDGDPLLALLVHRDVTHGIAR